MRPMRQPLITVENFKFTIFDSVPKPNEDTAYILYREGRQKDPILVITNQKPVLSSDIRSGKFNKKAIMSLAFREIRADRTVSDETGHYKFFLSAKALYRVRDVRYVFVNHVNIDKMVSNALNEILDAVHKKYSIEEQTDLEDTLKVQLRNKLNNLDYLEISEPELTITVDERAQRIIDSTLDTIATSVINQNQEDIASLQIEQKKRLEQQKYEAQKEVQKKINALQLEQIKGFNDAKEAAGENASLVLAYLKGEISSVELDKRLEDKKANHMMTNLQALKQLADLQVLSDPALERAALKLLGETTAQTQAEQNPLLETIDAEDTIIVEDEEKY